MPSAVVVSAMATGTNARTSPAAYNSPTTPPASARVTSHDSRAASGVRAEQPLVDLVAGQEEQEAEPDVGQDLHALRRADPQALRPDQHSPEEEQDDLRNAGRAAARADGASTATTAIANSVPSVECTSTASSPLITRIVPEPGDAGQRPGAGP